MTDDWRDPYNGGSPWPAPCFDEKGDAMTDIDEAVKLARELMEYGIRTDDVSKSVSAREVVAIASALLAMQDENEKMRAALKYVMDAWAEYEGQGQVVDWDELHQTFGLDPEAHTYTPRTEDEFENDSRPRPWRSKP